jgi:transcription elongation factor GreA
MNKVPMTPEGHKKLQERLKHLKAVERPKVIEAIEVARGHGDLSENAEYDAAKEHQGQLTAEMRRIEHDLSLAQVIDPASLDHEKVVFGATVKLIDIDNDEEKCYQIVGIYESDIEAGRISIESPIARALIGKEAGDTVKVKTPNGIREFEILDITYV